MNKSESVILTASALVSGLAAAVSLWEYYKLRGEQQPAPSAPPQEQGGLVYRAENGFMRLFGVGAPQAASRPANDAAPGTAQGAALYTVKAG